MFYVLSILMFMALIILVNALFVIKMFKITFLTIVTMVVVSVLFVLIVDGVVAFFIRWTCPKNWFEFSNKFFIPSKKEYLFYEKIGIKNWKDKVLELGAFTGFRKSKMKEPTNNVYVERFIVEANYGVVVHFVSCIMGFLILLIYKKYWFCIGLPVALVNVFYNLLSLFILRYNLPKLHTLHRYNERRQKIASD